MICVRAIPTFVVNLNFNSPNWLRWMKSLAMTWNWNLLPITFSMSLPNILRRMIGWKDLEWSDDCLLGLEMTTVDNLLKWFDQCLRLIHVSTILMMLLRQLSCLRMDLEWFHDNLSSPGIDKLLYLLIACLNSSLENGFQSIIGLLLILSRTSTLILWWSAVLNVKWRAF